LVARADANSGTNFGSNYDKPRLYDAYGKELWTTEDALSFQPFRWKGQAGYISDLGTGLVYCWHRYYDPELGRWLTRDPIGLEGGVNTYAYCSGDPVNYVDPDGLRRMRDKDWDMLNKLLLYVYDYGIEGLSRENAIKAIRKALGEIRDYILSIRSEYVDPHNLSALYRSIELLGSERFGETNSSETVNGLKIGKGGSKCNQFVYYCHNTLPMNNTGWFSSDYYSANQLGSKGLELSGFETASNALPGGIAAFPMKGYELRMGTGYNFGHATIYVGNSILIYAGKTGIKLGTILANQPHHEKLLFRNAKN
jgi:RHS repeat-associated protein